MSAPPAAGHWERAARREFREFARRHHPDRGGDPAVFAAGVTAYRRRVPAAGRGGLMFHRRRRGLAVLTGWWSDRRAAHHRPSRVQ